MTRDVHTDEDLRVEVGRWLRANGIDPGDLPLDSVMSIADGKITFQRYLRNEHGRIRVNTLEHCVMTETVTVPLRMEPTPAIAQWLLPKCPACGR